MKGWTSIDERDFQSLNARRTAHRDKNRSALINAIDRMSFDFSDATDDDVADALINHADSIRDALEPFDSGVREAPNS